MHLQDSKTPNSSGQQVQDPIQSPVWTGADTIILRATTTTTTYHT